VLGQCVPLMNIDVHWKDGILGNAVHLKLEVEESVVETASSMSKLDRVCHGHAPKMATGRPDTRPSKGNKGPGQPTSPSPVPMEMNIVRKDSSKDTSLQQDVELFPHVFPPRHPRLQWI
jgi:hypothetical protein